MKTRWIVALGALLLVGALVVTGIGMAQAWGQPGSHRYGPGSMMGSGSGSMMGSGSGGMMGSGSGSMMGSGSGGMMGGYPNGQNQPNPSDATPVTGNTVTIENFAFQPANLQVTVGATVTWTNKDTAPHTVTFQDSSLKSSGILRQGDTYSYTFTKVGAFAYYCDLHRYMTAQVIVTQ
jgi:plastocyanin